MSVFLFDRANRQQDEILDEANKFKGPSASQVSTVASYPEQASSLEGALEGVVDRQNASMKQDLAPKIGAPIISPRKPAPFVDQIQVPVQEPIQEPTQAPVQDTGNAIQQAIADVKAGMPIEEFSKYYPELASKADSFRQLKSDMDAGIPDSLIQQYYPEIFQETAAKPVTQEPFSASQALGESISSAASGFAKTVGGVAQKTGESFMQNVGRIGEAGEGLKSGKYNYPQAALRGGVAATSALFAPAAGILGQATEETVGLIPEQKRQEIAKNVSEKAKPLVNWYEKLPEDQKQSLRDAGVAIEGIMNLTGAGVITKQVGKQATKEVITETPKQFIKSPMVGAGIRANEAVKTGKEAIKKGKGVFDETISRVAEGDKSVSFKTTGEVVNLPIKKVATEGMDPKTYEKARTIVRTTVRPSIRGIDTGAKYKGLDEKLVKGAKSTAERTGQAEDGIDALVKAGEAKKKIWKELETQTGKAKGLGAEVNPNDVVNRLLAFRKEIGDEIFTNPRLGQKLDEQIEIWSNEAKKGNIGIDVAEARKVGYNKQMGNFLTALDRTDGIINAKLSQILGDLSDDAVENSLGRFNSSLRQEYGAVREFEKNLAKRMGVFERQSNKGLPDMIADMPSAGALAMSFLTGDIRGAAAAGGMQIAKIFTKRANDPNRQIKELFKLFAPGKYDKKVKFKVEPIKSVKS